MTFSSYYAFLSFFIENAKIRQKYKDIESIVYIEPMIESMWFRR
jgi:hypothetical protein